MTSTLTKSDIFTSAWIKAREMAALAGTGPKAQFAAALRATYQAIRDLAAAEAQAKADRLEALYEEMEELNGQTFGARASAMKSRHTAQVSAIQAPITALAA
ncbi:MAG: hypothetical protein Q7T93_13285 [Methylobacterium sp.]|uniref:hypothetical protein n=1 Tax=Methylobacterium sp. TaxID=409 RepID=UPI00271CD4F9|nr:hypothetical protein [Methylobacterium sp.]MDO9427790.1 hypothetical protein [Methylobacterium sp.]